MSLLELDSIDVFYGRVQALRGVSMRVEEGEVVALIGSNGAGKTTTLRSISGLSRPSGGTVTFEGRRISGLAAEKVSRLGIGHAPEGRRLFPRMSVAENLDMGAYSRRDRSTLRAEYDKIYGLFPRLAERRRQLAGSLSGGEQQMVAIGRALLASPKLLLLDEVMAGLNAVEVEQALRMVRQVRESGVTIVLIEHVMKVIVGICTRALVLNFGRPLMEGPPETVLRDPRVIEAYLGERYAKRMAGGQPPPPNG